MGQLDASIVTVALPAMRHAFHASVGSVTWVGLSYLVVLVATVTAVGRSSDMWGRKLVYVYGFVVFVAASALCGLAPGLVWLCVFRAVQAIGAAMLQANSLAIIFMAVPQRALGRAVGLQGAAQAIGLALGPSVGGLLVAAGGWRLIFLVNVPLGVLGAIAALVLVPRSRHLQARTAFDRAGLSLFLPAVVCLLTAASFGATLGWGSPLIVLLLAGAFVSTAVFVRHERRAPAPMLDPALFRIRRFATGIASGLGSSLVLFGILLLVPFYLTGGLAMGAARAGLELMVVPLAFGIVAPIAGRAGDRVGSRRLTAQGMGLVAIGLCLLAFLRPSTPGFLLLLAVVGAGLGLFTSPNNAGTMAAAPAGCAGMASGVVNMTRGLGTALGLALTGLVYTEAGGATGSALRSGHAFSVAALVLGGVAALSAVVAADPWPGRSSPTATPLRSDRAPTF
jgi:EmrB/QacA subfamily drug resistance transporter